jgi:hypothetical protein
MKINQMHPGNKLLAYTQMKNNMKHIHLSLLLCSKKAIQLHLLNQHRLIEFIKTLFPGTHKFKDKKMIKT